MLYWALDCYVYNNYTAVCKKKKEKSRWIMYGYVCPCPRKIGLYLFFGQQQTLWILPLIALSPKQVGKVSKLLYVGRQMTF